MAADVKRSPRGTIAAVINFALVTVTGIILIGNEVVTARSALLWIVIGVLLLIWAGVILRGLFRPVLMSTDATGVSMRRLTGYRRFLWQDLVFASFESSPRAVIIGGFIDGNMRYAAISKKAADPAGLAAAQAEFQHYRPGLPEQMVRPGQATMTQPEDQDA